MIDFAGKTLFPTGANGIMAHQHTLCLAQDVSNPTAFEVAITAPLKRLGTGREVAQAVAFLLSDWSSFITGEALHVNGGLYISG